MKRAVGALLACALVAAAPSPAQPLTFWWWASSGHENEVRDALECALGRWRAAACIEGLDVSLDAAHWVRTAPADQLGELSGWTTGATWNSTRIRLIETALPAHLCQILTHEIGAHVLQRRNDAGHLSEPDDAISHTPTSMRRGRITAEDLEKVCERQDCGCNNPEPAVQ